MKVNAVPTAYLKVSLLMCVPDIPMLKNVQRSPLRLYHVIHWLNPIPGQKWTQMWHIPSIYNLKCRSGHDLENEGCLYSFLWNIWTIWFHSCLCLYQCFLDDSCPHTLLGTLPVNDHCISHWSRSQLQTFVLIYIYSPNKGWTRASFYFNKVF